MIIDEVATDHPADEDKPWGGDTVTEGNPKDDFVADSGTS
jgi:hypothetical protein